MIERAKGGEMPMSEAMDEGGGDTATLPLSLLGGQEVSPGDVIRLKVVSVDTENDLVDVAYDHPKKPQRDMSDMTERFDKAPGSEMMEENT